MKFVERVHEILEKKDDGSSFKNTYKIAVQVFKSWMKKNKQYTFEYSASGKTYPEQNRIESIYDKNKHVGTYNYEKGELYTTEISLREFKGL